MASALAKASSLKAEIRLAQAVSEFEADLSNEQKSTFRNLKSQTLATAPDPSDVMRLTADVDRRISKKFGGQCFGPRFTNFLQGVQQFTALGDVVVGGSQNLVACGVWSLVRMSLLSMINLSNYIDQLSSLFMEIGRSAPRHQAIALIYPQSPKLQSYLDEYFIVAVHLCHHLFKFGQKSTIQQFTSTLIDSKLTAFRTGLNEWADAIKEEVGLKEAQANSGFRALSRKMFKVSSYQQRLVTNLRVLDFCSTYNYQTTWKQTRKAGHASFLMGISDYQEWRDCADPCTLMYTGKLGSGKSVLLANIVDDLNLSAEKERFAVTYFFCRHDVPESLKARTIIGSLARQLLCTIPDLADLSESCENTRFTGDIEEVSELLFRGFPSSCKAYFVLDGLDECDDEEKEILVEAFQKIQKTLKILLCISFRIEPNNSLQSITERLVATRIVSIPEDNPDIEAFIEADLERCLRHKRLIIGDPTLVLSIHDALLKGSQGMFLWVALQIQSLCSMKTDRAIREALADLPKDLSETFARILRKSGNSDQSLQVKTLQIVLAASRPLITDELREALSVIPGDATWDPSKLLNDVNSALACCGCLIIVDEEESTVRIVHHSVKQYIFNGPNSVNNVNFSAEMAKRVLADIVVTYLGYGVFGTELSRAKVNPVMAQSAPSRVMHATMGPSSATLKVAMKLLKSRSQPDFDISKTLAEARGPSKSRLVNEFWFYSYANFYWQDHVFYVSGQDAGILKLSAALIQSRVPETSMMSKDCWIHSIWAAENGNKSILELMLKTGKIDANVKDTDGRTTLIWAAQNGNEDIVEMLLRTGKVDVNAKTNDGWTPVIRAAQRGHKAIVELLLSTDKVDVDATNNYGSTSLSWAAQSGYKDIVELLLSTGNVNVNAGDNSGSTPLMLATQGGYKDIVEVLLGIGKVDVDMSSNGGFTALMQAAQGGHKDIFEMLLRTGKAEADLKTNYGWTPLMLAAQRGHKDIVELLLNTGNVDVNSMTNDGWTPLVLAIQRGHDDIVEMLCNTGMVDVDAKTNDGWTPLMRAAQRGHNAIVELLLSTGKVKIDAKTNAGSTPLFLAAQRGSKDIVKLLLSTGKVDSNELLSKAAQSGDKGIIEILLSTGEVDADGKTNDGWTPLMRAAQKGHKDIVKLLLCSNVHVDATNKYGSTPLSLAAQSGYKDIVELLLRTGKVNVNADDNSGSTPLLLATQGGHKDTVEVLLSTGHIDVDAKTNFGWTPLMLAAQKGHEDIVKLLLSTGRANVSAMNQGGTTALTRARQSKHIDIVALLQSHMDHP